MALGPFGASCPLFFRNGQILGLSPILKWPIYFKLQTLFVEGTCLNSHVASAQFISDFRSNMNWKCYLMPLQYMLCLFAAKFSEVHNMKLDRAELLLHFCTLCETEHASFPIWTKFTGNQHFEQNKVVTHNISRSSQSLNLGGRRGTTDEYRSTVPCLPLPSGIL